MYTQSGHGNKWALLSFMSSSWFPLSFLRQKKKKPKAPGLTLQGFGFVLQAHHGDHEVQQGDLSGSPDTESERAACQWLFAFFGRSSGVAGAEALFFCGIAKHLPRPKSSN